LQISLADVENFGFQKIRLDSKDITSEPDEASTTCGLLYKGSGLLFVLSVCVQELNGYPLCRTIGYARRMLFQRCLGIQGPVVIQI
jgi:hypothetical protein